MERLWSVPIMVFLLGPANRTRRNLQRRRSYSRTLCLRSFSFRWLETCRPKHHHRTRPADIFSAAAVPGCSAALDVCAASPKEAAARGKCRQNHFNTEGNTKFRWPSTAGAAMTRGTSRVAPCQSHRQSSQSLKPCPPLDGGAQTQEQTL